MVCRNKWVLLCSVKYQLQLDIGENNIVQLSNLHAKELTNEDLMQPEQQMIAFEHED